MYKLLIAAVMGAGIAAFSASSALAYVACSGNTCWHVKERYKYPARSKVIIHEDNWTPSAGVTFKEHEGRGYWRGGVWTSW
jgi:hypothetical protein